jgi:transcription elongation GreA/GreB family factor
MLSKKNVYEACLNEINTRHLFYIKMINELKEGAINDAKSSAGDKHETARAMMQIEQEKATKQMNEVLEMKSIIEKIGTFQIISTIGLGSLVKTNIGYFYIAIPIGKLQITQHEVFVISPKSPLGSKLLGLKQKDAIEFNARKIIIESVN